MPEICRFLGIVIAIFYKDHSPPHFHAKYGEKMGIFSIDEIKLIEGNLPPRVVSLVIEWALIHKNELKKDWDLALQSKPLNKIEPLTYGVTMLEVKSAEYLNEYKIKVVFSNGESKVVDLSNHLTGEIFEPVREKEYFKTFYFNDGIGTICWNNGADLAPEFLYDIGK